MVGSVFLLFYGEAGWMQRTQGLGSEGRLLVPVVSSVAGQTLISLLNVKKKDFFFSFLERKLQRTVILF